MGFNTVLKNKMFHTKYYLKMLFYSPDRSVISVCCCIRVYGVVQKKKKLIKFCS